MQKKLSRRTIVKGCALSAALIPGIGLLADFAMGAGLPPLDPNDPLAKSLGFATDTTKVDAATNPTHAASQRCGVCAQFQGKPGDATGGCNIFTGKSVPQNGWCKVWVQKPA
jgi:hypothetical protein